MVDSVLGAAVADATFGNYERVVEALATQSGHRMRLRRLSRVEALFVQERALGFVQVVVVRFDRGNSTAIEQYLRSLIRSARTPLEVVLVGGDHLAKGVLARSRPLITRTRIGLLHIADDRHMWSKRSTIAGKLRSLLDERPPDARPASARWASLLEQGVALQHEAQASDAELQTFASRVAKRTPLATWSIVLVNAAVFGVEHLLGGPSSPPVLVRMGSLMPARIVEGEWWRLVSCTFLHGDILHLLFNMYVLVILGGFLERLIGPARFVVLYAVAAILGSAGSAAFLEAQMSVGASGAVWGLLGAHAVLAYRPQGLLPAALIPGAKRAAKINLAINVVNSFRPYVDMWAHFAGGLAGAAVLVSGVLTRKLPRLGEIEQGRWADGAGGVSVPTSGAIRVAGMIAALVLGSGIVAAFALGRPLQLAESLSMQPTAVPELGVSLLLPPGLRSSGAETPEGRELVFGDGLADPMTVAAYAADFPSLDAEALAAQIEDLKTTLETPEGTQPLSPPTTFESGDRRGLVATYVNSAGNLVYERAYSFSDDTLLRVDVLRWTAHPKAAPEGSARRIAESATRLAP